jgi:hypothetical protein
MRHGISRCEKSLLRATSWFWSLRTILALSPLGRSFLVYESSAQCMFIPTPVAEASDTSYLLLLKVWHWSEAL